MDDTSSMSRRASVATPAPPAETGESVAKDGRLAPWILGLVATAAYAAVSIRRHVEMKTTSYDLGIFEQAVRSYAHLHLPTSSLKGPGYPILGDHFSPILALLAPFYRLAPTPITLLAAQALLCGLSVVPITAMAIRAVGRRAGLVLGVSYAFSWGIQNTIVFDFHEVCFAVPILAFSLAELVKRNLRSAILIALPLVLVKEDLPLTLAAIGVCVYLFGDRKWGAITAVAGVAVSALLFLVVIPAFNPAGHNDYLATRSGPGLASRLLTESGTIAALLVLGGIVCLRSPLLLIAVPTLAWRFVSNNELYWGTRFHYSAVLMPIIFMALVDALEQRPLRPWIPKAAVAVSLIGSIALGFQLCLSDLVRPKTWHTSQQVALQKLLLKRIPDGASVAAPNRVGPQLTNRTDVFLYPWWPNATLSPDFVLAEGHPRGWPYTPEQKLAGVTPMLNSPRYTLVATADDLYLFKRAN